MQRLKAKDVATYRTEALAIQGAKCGLCKLTISGDAVLDHDHATGAVREVLHRGCNSLLGKVENNHKRYGVRSLAAFLIGAAGYLAKHEINRTNVLHPTHKTEDEKRISRNTKARKTRAAKKAL
jgi:hypothetical protein